MTTLTPFIQSSDMAAVRLQHLLLDLLSTRRPVPQPVLDALSPGDWKRLLGVAHKHRLLQMLHWRLRHERADLVVAEPIRSRLQDAYRRGTLRALDLQRELAHTVRVLADAGVPCLALKGAYLAFAVYPQPAMRPLRDLDLLVRTEHALAAHSALRAAGFESTGGDLETCLALKQHLPPLVAPQRRIHVEVHTRLTHDFDPRKRGLDPADLWQRRIRHPIGGQEVGFVAPTDLLLHLIHHAAYDHQFDNGPLILCDLAGLIRAHAIDWPAFWQRATDSGWRRGCLLLLRMTEHYFGELAISYQDIAADELRAAARFAESAGTLMLNDHDRLYGKLVNSLAGQSLPGKLRILARRVFPAPSTLALYNDTRQGPFGLLQAYGRKLRLVFAIRLPQLLGELRRSSTRHDIRREARQVAELGRWLARS